jgi:hypothetical protein
MFAGLVTRFLSQSINQADDDPLWHYIVPSIGCAAANWLGNGDRHLAAWAVVAASLWYAYYFLWRRPSAPPEG